jgi:peptide/nickel transport system substrate-binding protein
VKKSAWLLLCLTLVFSLFLTACGKKETQAPVETPKTPETPADPEAAKYGGTLTIGMTGSPTLFNTLYSTDTASSNIEGVIYDSLMGGNEKFETITEGGLAEEFTVSEDGMEYTVKITDKAKFHDGEPLDIDDVIFTYNIPLHPDYDGPRASYFQNVGTIEKIDQYTMKITLSEFDATFSSSGFGWGILPEHILKDVPVADLGEHTFNTKNPIGSGPYKFVEWLDGQYVKVAVNEEYWDGRAYIDTLIYKIVTDASAMLSQLEAGDINMFNGVPAGDVDTVNAFIEAKGLKMVSGLALSYNYLGLNQTLDKFKDVRVRQAITHALDREAIVANVLKGRGQVAHVSESPLSWAYNPDVPVFEYSVDKANALLEEAGWIMNADGFRYKDGEKFTMDIKTNQGNKTREDIAVIAQQQLKAVGIDVTPTIMEWSALLEKTDTKVKDYEATIMGWALGTTPNPANIFHSRESVTGLNNMGYANAAADELMDLQLKEADFEKRKAMIHEIGYMLAEDQAYTFLYYPEEFRAMPANLEGYTWHARSPLYNISKWYFAK